MLLDSLFTIQPIKPVQDKKKKDKVEEVHQYIRLAEKGSDKVKKTVQRMKQEQTMTSEQIKTKRAHEKVLEKFVKQKTQVSASGQRKKYMPTVVDPFKK